MIVLSKQLAPLLAISCALTLGCFAHQNVKRDKDDQPTIHHGVGASIVYPGGRGPAFPTMPPGALGGGGSGTQTQSNRNGQQSGSGSQHGGAPDPERSGGGGMTYIGGNQGQETSSRTFKQEPRIIKLLGTPVAIAAYPVKKAIEAVRPSVEGPQPTPEAAPQPRYSDDVHADHEREELEAMRRELEARGDSPAPRRPSAQPGDATRTRAARPQSSIAEELARLRGEGVSVSGLPEEHARVEPSARSPRREILGADRVADRNRDGQPDHWRFLEAGQLAREQFDEDADGSPDRTVYYDPATGERARLEEDSNGDGILDTWLEYRDGAIAKRRGDGDADGQIDRWVFYRRGQISRLEEDLDGDGYRDRVGHYENGKVAREEEDRDGDGRTDRISFYDESETLTRRDEDRDGDGVIDVRSHYENGKLSRREMVEQAADEAIEPEALRPDPAFGER
jgi:antitoxin component YwqK of YwqJK toxin-antitoxin module